MSLPITYALLSRRAQASDIIVYDSSQLSLALAGALPGDQIILAGGSFAGNFVAPSNGLPESPIVIRPALPLGAAIAGSITVTGAHTWLSGLVLDGATVELAADGARMTRCRQLDTDGIALLVSRGLGVEIDYNELSGMRDRGISLKPSTSEPNALRGARIHHNYIHDFVGVTGTNVHEAVQLGQTKTHTDIGLFATLEWNLFERVSVDSECVSIKSSDNIVRSNTLLDCRGHLTNRHGERNEISGNWLDGTLGIRCQDRGGKVIGNWLRNSLNGLQVMAGNVAASRWPNEGTHPAAEKWLIAGNNADKCKIGFAFDGHKLHALDTRVEAHVGQVGMGLQKRTSVAATTALAMPTLYQMQRSEVGPEVPVA